VCVGSLESRQQLSEIYVYVKNENRFNVVGIMTTLQVRRFGVRIPAAANYVFLL
jgi:hypothetical protein